MRSHLLPLLLLLLSLLHGAPALWLGECNKPLGVSTGDLSDSALTASSVHDHIVGPHLARLGVEEGGGAWCPRTAVDPRQVEWLEVDLGTPRLLTGVATQGRNAGGEGQEYTPAYTLSYWHPGMEGFTFYTAHPATANKTLLVGNSDTYTEVKNSLARPLLASKVRLQPYSAHPRTVCLRMELYGCNYTDGLVSYSVGGEPYKRLVGVDESVGVGAGVGESVGVGEGLLFDGRVGGAEEPPTPLLRQGVEGLEPAPDTPVVMIFNFDVMRKFKALYLYLITSQPGAQPSIHASVKFGSNATHFDPSAAQPLTFPAPLLLPTGPHNLSLDLALRPAVSLLLEVDVRGLEVDILEVYFESAPCGCKLGDWEKRPPTAPEEHTQSRPHPPSDDVWAVYTAHQHRAYVGVAVGFSVGVGVLILVWAGVWVRRKRGKISSPRVFRRPPPDTLDMKSLMSVGMGVGVIGSATPTYEEGSCLLYEDLQKTPLVTPIGTPRISSITPPPPPMVTPLTTPLHTSSSPPIFPLPPPPSSTPPTPVYATPTLKPSSTFPSSVTFTSFTPTYTPIPRPLTLATIALPPPHGPPPVPPPPEKFDTQIQVPSVTGPWLTCVYRHDPPAPSATPAPTPTLLSPGRVTRTDLLASGAFATLSVGVVADEREEELGQFGQQTFSASCQAALVSVSAHKAAPTATRQAQLLASLRHDNVCGLVGVLVGGPVVGVTLVLEYRQHAHLPEYLHAHTLTPSYSSNMPAASYYASTLLKDSGRSISVGEVVGLARGVAAGMAYLESHHVTHTDLAARNVLVIDGVVKVTQVGSALPRYSSDYWRPPDGRGPAPLRWCSPEALCQGQFTSASDVWSFGVVVWELLTLARRRPHQHLSDDLLFHALASTFRRVSTLHPSTSTGAEETYATPQLVLTAPAWCPRDVEEVMTSCWRPYPAQRPTFASILASLSTAAPTVC